MILIIAYGNTLRRDDGAGLLLAEQLETLWQSAGYEIDRIPLHQLTPELADDIGGEGITAVVFVDSRAIALDEAQADIQLQPITSDDTAPSFGHVITPTTLLMYARLIYGKQPSAWLVTIPGVDFRHGEGVSDTVQRLLADIPANLQRLPERFE